MRKLFLSLVLCGLASITQAQEIDGLARTCNGCHGVDGVSAGQSIPSIGGLAKDYFRKVMRQWKNGQRDGITMPRIAKGLSDAEIEGLAVYFANLPWVPVAQAQPSPKVMALGEFVSRDICIDCHGLKGNEPERGVPRIDGQWAKYMELEGEKYQHQTFKMPSGKMKKALQEISPAESAASAHYFSAPSK